MLEYDAAHAALGVGGVLSGLSHCNARDRNLAISDASLVIPETAIRQSAQLWKLTIQMSFIKLMYARESSRLLLLGADLGFLEALAALDYNGEIQLLLPPGVDADERSKIALNVPVGVGVEVLTPGLVPVLGSDVTVVAIGFDAGGGYIMMDDAAARALGGIRGQRFTGDVIALLPLGDLTVHERLPNWQMVGHDHFTDLCTPEGLEPVLSTI